MSLEPPLRVTADDGDIPLDLQTIFKHPAGLRTARHIVRAFVRASQDDIALGDFSSVSYPTFDSTPEVTSRLIELLSFSDSGNMALDHHNEISPLDNGFRTLHESGPTNEPSQVVLQPLPRTSSMNRSYQTMLSDGLPPPRYPLGSGIRQRPLQNISLLNDCSPFRSESPALGTESPYRVESPSGQANGQAQHSNNKDSVLSLLETDPFQLDLSPRLPPASTQSMQTLASGMRTFSYRQMDSGQMHPPRTYSNLAANPQQQAYKDTPTIKNFLPVNKPSVGENSMFTIAKDGMNDKSQSTGEAIVRGSALGYISPNNPPYHNLSSSFTTSQTIEPSSSTNNDSQTIDLDPEPSAMAPKRLASDELPPAAKKRKTNPKTKKKKPLLDEEGEPIISAKEQITQDLIMRILEYTPPSFLKKARLVSKEWKEIVDNFDSIFVNQRIEMYGEDMPGPPPGLNERQYNDLLGGKGCMEPHCSDKLSSRAHWSWYKRWCTSCWEAKVEREDKVIKAHQNQYGRTTVTQMLECIPAGMHDSFMKPHTYVEDGPEDNRSSSAPRIYRCYLQSEVEEIMKKYDALTPAPYKENPLHTAAEKAAALAAHQAEMQALEQKRLDFFEVEKKKNEAHMTRIRKIEECVRRRRELNGAPNQQNRNSRRELFTKRAEEDLSHIPIKFVQSTKCYKAATRIFRDGGTERGWQTLKPKIVKEWEESEESKKKAQEASSSSTSTEREVTNNDFEEVIERINLERIPCRPQNQPLIARDNCQTQAFLQHQMQNQMHHQIQNHMQNQMQNQMHHQIHHLLGHGSLPSSRTSSPGLYAHLNTSNSFTSPLIRDSINFPTQMRNNFRPTYNFENNMAQINHQSNHSAYHPHSQSAYQHHYHHEQQQSQSGTTIPIAFLLSGSTSNSISSGEQRVPSMSQQAGPYGMFGPQN